MGEETAPRQQSQRPAAAFAVDQDAEHLKLLSIFHYIFGGLGVCLSCIPIIYVGLGLFLVLGQFEGGDAPPAFMGWLFAAVGVAGMIFGWASAALLLYAGYCLGHQKHHTFCMVVAALSCLQVPFGTILGVFTIVVLTRPSVKERFLGGDRRQTT